MTPPARDERTWTLQSTPGWWVVLGGPEPARYEAVEVLPIAAHEAALAAARQVDEAACARLHDSLRDAAWNDLHPWDESGIVSQNAVRAALLAALTVPEPEEKR